MKANGWQMTLMPSALFTPHEKKKLKVGGNPIHAKLTTFAYRKRAARSQNVGE